MESRDHPLVPLDLERFDVVRLRGAAAQGLKFVVLSASHLSPVNSVVIAPLVLDTPRQLMIRKLHVPLVFADELHVLLINELANVPRSLVAAGLGSVYHQHTAITAALDYLFQGY